MLEFRTYAALAALAITIPSALAQFGPPTVDALELAVDSEADDPLSAALTPDGSLLLVAHRDTDNVTFYDTALNDIVATVAVGDGPVHVAVTPDGTRAVVCNAAGNTVSLIDVATRTLTATIAVSGTEPYRAEITSDSQRALVGQVGTTFVTSDMSVIDLAVPVEVATFTTVRQGSSHWIGGPRYGVFELLPGDQQVMVPMFSGAETVVYDVGTGQPVQTLPIGSVADMEISADGSRAVLLRAFLQSSPMLNIVDLATWNTTVYATGNYSDYGNARVGFLPDNSAAIVVAGNTTFIDMATANVTTVQEGGENVCVSFDGLYALVTGQTARVFDVAAATAIASVPGAYRTVALAESNGYAAYSVGGYDEFIDEFDLQAATRTAQVPSGEGFELDDARLLAMMADDRAALVGCAESRNVCVVDLASRTVSSIMPMATTPWHVETDPVGVTSVALSLVPPTVTIFNHLLGTTVAVIPLPSIPVDVAYAPDASRVWIRGSADFGQMQPIYEVTTNPAGGTLVSTTLVDIGPPDYSGNEIAVSPDGATLAVTASTSELAFVETATRTTIGDFDGLAVADMLFDGPGRLITSAPTLGVRQFLIQGQAVTQGAPVASGGGDLLAYEPDSQRLLVASGGQPFVQLIDLANAVAGPAVLIPNQPQAVYLRGAHAFVRIGTLLLHYEAGSFLLSLVSASPTSGYGEAFGFSASTGLALAATFSQDHLDLFDFGDLPTTNYCAQTQANSQGLFGEIAADGVFFAGGGGPVELAATNLPPGQFGYFLGSRSQGFLMNPGGAMGNLCVVGNVARFSQSILTVDAAGTFAVAIDTLAIPTNPVVAVESGETWHFQAWYRDVNPGATSAFTNAVSVPFR